MRIFDAYQGTLLRPEFLTCAKDFARLWREIAGLRSAIGAENDVLTDPIHFLASTDESRRSCSVACWMGEELIGVLFATSHYVFGIPTGYAISGDYTGRGSLLCLPEHQSFVMECAVNYLLHRGVHSLHLRVAPAAAAAIGSFPGLAVTEFHDMIPGDRMDLHGSYDAFLGTLGKHTRRNVRYYTRRALAAGIVFDPEIEPAEYGNAIQRLNNTAGFSIGTRRMTQDDRLLELHGGKRFALRNKSGEIVAALCGFSKSGRFHLLTQTNNAELADLSLSLVLRGMAVEHLIATGHTELQFMGGSSLSFGRFCAQLDYRSLFIDRRRTFSAMLKILGSKVVEAFAKAGKQVPAALELLCGSYLAPSMLANRTALLPANVLKQEAMARAGHTADAGAEPAAAEADFGALTHTTLSPVAPLPASRLTLQSQTPPVFPPR